MTTGDWIAVAAVVVSAVALFTSISSSRTAKKALQETRRNNAETQAREASRKRGEEIRAVQPYREALEALAFPFSTVRTLLDADDLGPRLKMLSRTGEVAGRTVQDEQLGQFIQAQSKAVILVFTTLLKESEFAPESYPHDDVNRALEHLSHFTAGKWTDEERAAVIKRWDTRGREVLNRNRRGGT